jgi:hypothetical protein
MHVLGVEVDPKGVAAFNSACSISWTYETTEPEPHQWSINVCASHSVSVMHECATESIVCLWHWCSISMTMHMPNNH